MALKIFEREGSDGLTLVESMFGTTRGRVTSVVSQPFLTLGTDFLGGILALRRKPKSITFHAVHTRAVEAPKKKAGKKAPATGACRRLLRRLYIVNAA